MKSELKSWYSFMLRLLIFLSYMFITYSIALVVNIYNNALRYFKGLKSACILHNANAFYLFYIVFKQECLKINNILKTILFFVSNIMHNAYGVCNFNLFSLTAHLELTAICNLSYVD